MISGKRLSGKTAEKQTDPVKLYDTLDRAHDKGPLRPAQLELLTDWFSRHQGTRDIIVKLHTGQGKTLIGLLMLQARLNAGKGPALYLGPDNYLIEQTCDQARQFGIATCKADPELPDEFLSSSKILATSVRKLFNGLTGFGLNRQSIGIGSFLMDDAHACADTIREQCRIRIPRERQRGQRDKGVRTAWHFLNANPLSCSELRDGDPPAYILVLSTIARGLAAGARSGVGAVGAGA